MEASDTPTPVTDKTIAAQVPEEIIALILNLGTAGLYDLDEDDEIAALMPSVEVVQAVLAANGQKEPSPLASLDQAQAWLEEQKQWQDRAMKAEATLQEKFPFQKEQALKGEIPAWMAERWASKLIYKWSDGLKDAVENAESYITNKTGGASNG
jgi:hypothetical protein